MRDYERWQENPDGSWSRRLSQYSEIGINATAGAVVAAEDLGVDLARLKGTGTDGRITKADVVAAFTSGA